MTTYISTIHVDVPPEVASAQVVDLMTQSSGRMRCTVLEAPPEVVGTRFRYGYRLLGLAVEGTCTVTEYTTGESATFEWRGPERLLVGHLRGEWAFAADDGGTTITVRSVVEPYVPGLHHLGARMMIRAFRNEELPTMKAEMEARPRGARPAP